MFVFNVLSLLKVEFVSPLSSILTGRVVDGWASCSRDSVPQGSD